LSVLDDGGERNSNQLKVQRFSPPPFARYEGQPFGVIGHDGDLSILVDLRSWDGNDPDYELYDVGRHLSYRVKEIPTPNRAATLLKKHGKPPEEE
jgi:hypothetical protein